jgi:hypothetical protein
MEKPKTLDKVKYALYRTMDTAPTKLPKAKWIVYGAVAVTTTLMFADGPQYPKYPRGLGD